WRRIGTAHCWTRRRRRRLGGTSRQQKQQRRNQGKFDESLHGCKTPCHIALTLFSIQSILPIATGETRPETGATNFFLNPQWAVTESLRCLASRAHRFAQQNEGLKLP